MDWGLIVTVATTLIGWAVLFGILKQKINDHDKELAEIKAKQAQMDSLMQSINNSLVALNTKVDLLMDGKLNTK